MKNGANFILSSDYEGTQSKPTTGKTCQKWSEQYPHEHDYVPEKYPTIVENHNYCRDPDEVIGKLDVSLGAWCYTTDPELRWKYCECGDLTGEL